MAGEWVAVMSDPRWETDWLGVDPYRLRRWSDIRTWGELDYFIAARASMDHVNVSFEFHGAWMKFT